MPHVLTHFSKISMFVLQHQRTEQEHPEGQQEAERELPAEEEPAAGLQEIPGTVIIILINSVSYFKESV